MSRSTDIEHIRSLAIRFRSALDLLDRGSLPPGLAEFPNGSCREASLLLGAYFVDHSLGEYELVAGERGHVGPPGANTYITHSWIARNGILVDITADQFLNTNHGVIVATASVWHESFDTEIAGIADYRTVDPETNSELGAIYGKLASLADAA